MRNTAQRLSQCPSTMAELYAHHSSSPKKQKRPTLLSRKMYFQFTTFFIALLGRSFAHGASIQGGRDLQQLPVLELEDGALQVTLTPDSANSMLQVDMVYTSDDQGWLAWAFSEDEKMAGSVGKWNCMLAVPVLTNVVAVIALFQDDGPCTVEKYDMAGQFTPGKSQQQTLTDVSCSQTGTETTMSFKKLLAEEGEPEIFLEQPNNFLYAIGPPGNGFGRHVIRMPVPNVVLDAEAPITEAPTATPVDSGEAILLDDGRFLQPVLELEDGDLQVTFITDPVQEEIQIDMVYTSDDQGWLGWAFSENEFMPDSVGRSNFTLAVPVLTNAVAVIALFQDDGSCTVEKYDMTGRTTPGKSQGQTLKDVSCSQTGTETTMSFKKLLVEEGEPEIFLEQPNNFLYAIGPPGNGFGQHLIREPLPDFVFGAAPNLVDDNQALWTAHGLLMAISWAALVPLAVGSSLLRSLFPGQGLWFQVHRVLNSLGVAGTIAGFGIAVHLINEVPDAEHFQRIAHHKIGLVVFLFAFLQALSGIFRPHAPKKLDDGTEEPKTKPRVLFELQHKILGTITMILGWYNCDSGIDEYNLRFPDSPDLTTALWSVIAAISVSTLLLGLYARLVKKD